jgi:hypothetical protein
MVFKIDGKRFKLLPETVRFNGHNLAKVSESGLLHNFNRLKDQCGHQLAEQICFHSVGKVYQFDDSKSSGFYNLTGPNIP